MSQESHGGRLDENKGEQDESALPKRDEITIRLEMTGLDKTYYEDLYMKRKSGLKKHETFVLRGLFGLRTREAIGTNPRGRPKNAGREMKL